MKSREIKILGSAIEDLIDGYRFYEGHLEGGGTYFLDSLFSDIDSLIVNASIHQLHFGRYHRMLSKRFPFALARGERAILEKKVVSHSQAKSKMKKWLE